MTDDLAFLRGRTIPVVCWNFFSSHEDSSKNFNSTTWEGFDSRWVAIATDGKGDAIVVADSAIYLVEHGTGNPACLGRKIDGNPEQFLAFIRKLSTFEDCSTNDSIPTLRLKRDALTALKKEAPKPLKEHFSDALADAKELIEDVRWKQSPAGKLQTYLDLNHRSWENEILEKWNVTGLMIRRHVSNKAVAVMGSADADSIDAIISHISKLSSYPIINLIKVPHVP